MNNKKFWEFKAQANSNEADLYLYLEIASWGGGYAAHSAKSFKQEMDNLGEVDTLNVYINSPGGDVFEGNAIYNMLKRKGTKCKLNVYVDGLAASIASVIAMAGTNVKMPSNALMMVHNAWTVCLGNSIELRKAADNLDKVNIAIKQAYLDKAGLKLDDQTITNLMNDETWLTAQEAFNYGLCDEIVGQKNISNKYDNEVFKNYKNVPKGFFYAEKPQEGNNTVDKEIEALIERVNNKAKNWREN